MAFKGAPSIYGNLEISNHSDGIFIGGDPDGLRSLAALLLYLAECHEDPEFPMPCGSWCHVHLYAQHPVERLNSLTPLSVDTMITRLDAKGTRRFPEKYYEDKGIYAAWVRHRRRNTKEKVMQPAKKRRRKKLPRGGS